MLLQLWTSLIINKKARLRKHKQALLLTVLEDTNRGTCVLSKDGRPLGTGVVPTGTATRTRQRGVGLHQQTLGVLID